MHMHLRNTIAARLMCGVFSASYVLTKYCMLNVFLSFSFYPVSTVLRGGRSTGQASTNFKMGNIKTSKNGLLSVVTNS